MIEEEITIRLTKKQLGVLFNLVRTKVEKNRSRIGSRAEGDYRRKEAESMNKRLIPIMNMLDGIIRESNAKRCLHE